MNVFPCVSHITHTHTHIYINNSNSIVLLLSQLAPSKANLHWAAALRDAAEDLRTRETDPEALQHLGGLVGTRIL